MATSNSYDVQYWIYAIINSTFGKQAKIKRSRLHHIYEANRHSFDVTGVDAVELKKRVVSELIDSGYQPDEYGFFSKLFDRRGKIVQISISISLIPAGLKDQELNFSVFSYTFSS